MTFYANDMMTIRNVDDTRLKTSYPKSNLDNKNSDDFNVYIFKHGGMCFYFYEPEIRDLFKSFIHSIEVGKKCKIKDYLNDHVDIITYYIVLFQYDISTIADIQAKHARMKEHIACKRLLSLFIINTLLNSLGKSNMYLFNKTFIFRNIKSSIQLPAISQENVNDVLRILRDNLSINKSLHINSIIIDVSDKLFQAEKTLGVTPIFADDSLLSPVQKQLFLQLCPLIAWTKNSAITFCHLIHLFITDPNFVSGIVAYHDQSFFIQYKRHLSELVLWFRFISFCRLVMHKHYSLFTKADFIILENFTKYEQNLAIRFDPTSPFSKKKGNYILYILSQATSYYIHHIFVESIELIYRILTANYKGSPVIPEVQSYLDQHEKKIEESIIENSQDKKQQELPKKIRGQDEEPL